MRGSIEGRNLAGGRLLRVTHAEGRIVEIIDAGTADGSPWLAPGLVDLQVNGCAGLDLNTDILEPHHVQGVSHHLTRSGVTSYLPTLVTGPDQRIRRSLRVIARSHADGVAAIHLEGPFVSPQDGPRGAHDRRYVRAPDWDLLQRWQEAAEGQIRLLTLSPEWPGTAPFIERCVTAGIVVAIGHTAATEGQIHDAVAAGARLSTHLGNASHPMMPRHTGYFWEQLGCDRLHASVIADGAHLPVPVLKAILRTKGDRAVLISDAVALTSLQPGEYEVPIGGRVRLTDDRRLVLVSDPRMLAGSVRLLHEGVAHIVGSGLAPLANAWSMASVGPARLLSLPCAAGLTPGAPADLVQFDWDGRFIVPRAVYRAGRLVAGVSIGGKGETA